MKVTIDHTTLDVPSGTTVLKAAAQLGIRIPTLCFMENSSCNSSCMVCMVRDLTTGKFFPSCAMPVHDGMQVQTHSPEIHELRRQALELLLGDHVGDCEAPCRLSCPAFMNIPLMNRLISAGHFGQAIDIVREEIALPVVLGYICQAPCEKACHRKSVDEAVSICMLKRFAALEESQQVETLLNGMKENNGSVAVIGSGPAGLSAAFYLRRMGYSVKIFEKGLLPGGALRYSIPEDKLPVQMLEREIDTLKMMGVEILTGVEITAACFERVIIPGYSAVILATGNTAVHPADSFSLVPDEHGNLVNRKTGATSRPGVFGCGSLIKDHQMAVRSAAQGKLAAIEADLYITSGHPRRPRFHFHSAISHLLPGEEAEYLKESVEGDRIRPSEGWLTGYSAGEAIKEASRCMHCDCRKPVTCKLRILSDEYHANRKRFQGPARKQLTRITRHDLLVYEPEKCIKCGRCVEITTSHCETLGLTFIGRGFDVKIGVPLQGSLQEGIEKSAFSCVEGCPTGALAFKDQEEGVEYGKRHRATPDGWENIVNL